MNLSSLRFLSVGHLAPTPDWALAPHSHPFHELIVVVAGRLGVEMRGQTIVASAGEILWYPQNITHREWTDPHSPAETFFLSFEYPQPSAHPLHQPDSLGRIETLTRWLFAEREANASSSRSPADNAFLHAILAEHHRLATIKDNPLITRLRSYMRRHLATPITLDELALHARISKCHFVRQYKLLTSRTPMQDLRHLRILAARDLLLTTNLPLKEIGPRTGLGDEYHLSHLFRKHFNISPGALRRNRGREKEGTL